VYFIVVNVIFNRNSTTVGHCACQLHLMNSGIHIQTHWRHSHINKIWNFVSMLLTFRVVGHIAKMGLGGGHLEIQDGRHPKLFYIVPSSSWGLIM